MKCKDCDCEIGDAIHIMRKNGDRVCLSCMPFVEPNMADDRQASQLCEWPGCNDEALCKSGNYDNKLVCKTHFKITNGMISSENEKL